jgi:HD domain
MIDPREAEIHRELPFITEIADAELRAMVERVWLRLWQESGLERLADAPWFTVTRAERQTPTRLVEHICQVADAAIGLVRVARRQGSKPDVDLLLAGAALIDADKLVMTDHMTGEPSEAARYSQHTFYGAHIARAEGAPWPVVHMILSHSKNTGVRPQTLEAVILHYADYAVFDLRNILEGRDTLAAEEKPRWSRS